MISRSTHRRCGPVVALGVLVATLTGTVQCTAAPLLHVEVYDRSSGRVLDQRYHRGRRYVAGEPGHEYSIRVRNVSNGRLLAVVGVDGVNVITGETAAPDQSGYVISPGEVVEIQGWRKNLERTAAFYFTDVSDAYATRTGRPGNTGVIGIAAFRERPLPSFAADPGDQSRVDEGAQAAPPMASSPLGTGHGRPEYSPAQRVDFERANQRPDQVVAVRYDSLERLMARGVIAGPTPPRDDPDPFPGAFGFVPDP